MEDIFNMLAPLTTGWGGVVTLAVIVTGFVIARKFVKKIG